MKHRLAAWLCLWAVLCLLGGCAAQPDTVFTCKDLTVSLPPGFMDLSEETYAQDADFLYGSGTLIVLGLSEDKTALNPMSLQTYTKQLISGNGLSCEPEEAGQTYRFTYAASINGAEYRYATAVFETDAYFWTVQCYCPSGDFSQHEACISQIFSQLPAGFSEEN